MAQQFVILLCFCGQHLQVDTDGPGDFECPRCARELTVSFQIDEGYVLELKEK